MSFRNSSSKDGDQRRDQIKNLTTPIDNALLFQQITSINNQSIPFSFFIRYKFLFLSITILVIFVLVILIFLLIKKCRQKENTKIQRTQAIIRRPFVPQSDDSHATLLKQNDGPTIDNVHVISNPDINVQLLTDPVLAQNITDTLPTASSTSKMSTSLPQLSVTNSENMIDEKDELANLDLGNIRLRCMEPANTEVVSTSSTETTKHPPNDLQKNPYIAAYEQEAKDKVKARKQYIGNKTFNDLTSSEESCL